MEDNNRYPALHAASHKRNGSDQILLDELGAPTDVTLLNATDTHHGLLLKLIDVTNQYLRADGTWAPLYTADPSLHVTGPSAPSLTSANTFVLFNAASGSITASLPAASSTPGIKYYLKRTDSFVSGTVVITPISGQIDGGASMSLGIGEGAVVMSDGSNYVLIAVYDEVSGAILANGTVTFTENQSMGGNLLTDLADPANDGDACNFKYVRNNVGGVGQKGCRVYASINQNGLANGSVTKVNFANIDYDRGGFFNTAAIPFKVPVGQAGTYRIEAQIMVDPLAHLGGSISFEIVGDGFLGGRGIALHGIAGLVADNYFTMYVSCEYELVAGEIIDFQLNNSLGGNINVAGAAGPAYGTVWASIRKISI